MLDRLQTKKTPLFPTEEAFLLKKKKRKKKKKGNNWKKMMLSLAYLKFLDLLIGSVELRGRSLPGTLRHVETTVSCTTLSTRKQNDRHRIKSKYFRSLIKSITTQTHACMDTHVFHDGAGGWVSEVFVSTDARRACPRRVIGSTMGAYPRGIGSNPVDGNGHFFTSCRQLYLSSFSDTHTLYLSSFSDTHTQLTDKKPPAPTHRPHSSVQT